MFVTATESYVTNTNSVLYTTVECSKPFGMAHGALENDSGSKQKQELQDVHSRMTCRHTVPVTVWGTCHTVLGQMHRERKPVVNKTLKSVPQCQLYSSFFHCFVTAPNTRLPMLHNCFSRETKTIPIPSP